MWLGVWRVAKGFDERGALSGDLRPQSHFRFSPAGTWVPIMFSPLMNMAIKEPEDLRNILLHDYAINMRSSRLPITRSYTRWSRKRVRTVNVCGKRLHPNH